MGDMPATSGDMLANMSGHLDSSWVCPSCRLKPDLLCWCGALYQESWEQSFAGIPDGTDAGVDDYLAQGFPGVGVCATPHQQALDTSQFSPDSNSKVCNLFRCFPYLAGLWNVNVLVDCSQVFWTADWCSSPAMDQFWKSRFRRMDYWKPKTKCQW